MLQLLLLVSFSIIPSLQQSLGCKSTPLPDLNGVCPSGTTLITGKGCCPDADVYTVTTTPTCVDKTNPSTGTSDCSRMVSYCHNVVYVSLMKEQCPKTCGYCSGSGTATSPSTTCVDKTNPSTGTSDCSRMASYCNNSAYLTLMKQQCPKTCGYCTSG